jgi:hypothetical protein
VCGPNLGGFDAWVLLRQEALPFAARADSLANAQLQQQLKAQRRRCEGLLLSALEAEAADGDDDDGFAQQKGKKRKNAASANGSGSSSSSGARGALVQLLHAGVGQVEAPKSSRAVLRSIPDQVGMWACGMCAQSIIPATCVFTVLCSWHDDGCCLPFGVAWCAAVDFCHGRKRLCMQLLHAGVGQVEAPKSSRAVLRSIPDQVGTHVGPWHVCV